MLTDEIASIDVLAGVPSRIETSAMPAVEQVVGVVLEFGRIDKVGVVGPERFCVPAVSFLTIRRLKEPRTLEVRLI